MLSIANQNVLVTGGAGFIGSHLCDSLLADGSAAHTEQALFGRFLTAFGFSEDAFRPHFETIALKNDKSVFNT